MELLIRPGDHILGAEVYGQDKHEKSGAEPRQALAFCPTPRALARIEAHGFLAPRAPELAILQRANHRAFCAELGQTLPCAAYVTSMAALEEVIRGGAPYQTFILKRAFGFAGRERRKAPAAGFDASTRGFAERSFQLGQGLQVEPWLTRDRDFALHGYVSFEGARVRGPLMRQHCDAMGRWERSERASEQDLDPALHRQLEEELERAAKGLHALGYFGPFGVDAFEYRDAAGRLAFQPRSEINASFSMGYPRELLESARSFRF